MENKKDDFIKLIPQIKKYIELPNNHTNSVDTKPIWDCIKNIINKRIQYEEEKQTVEMIEDIEEIILYNLNYGIEEYETVKSLSEEEQTIYKEHLLSNVAPLTDYE